MDTSEPESYTRRGLLRAGAGAATAGAVAATATTAAGAQGSPYGGYLDNVDNFDGTADARGADPVELTVGAGSDGLLFGPVAAVLIEPGTTVEWEWTGQGGTHNVVNDPELVDEPVFDSRPTHGDAPATAEAGTTFEHTFEEEGVYEYVCIPHRTVDMKGVIVVGEDNVEGDLVEFAFQELRDLSPIWGGAVAFGLVSFLGVAAYRALVDPERY